MVRGSLDGQAAEERFIGSPFFTGADSPIIGEILPETVTNTPSILLYAAGVSDADGISNVWIEITPPTNFAGNISHPIFWRLASWMNCSQAAARFSRGCSG